jgi:hypothetical protein
MVEEGLGQGLLDSPLKYHGCLASYQCGFYGTVGNPSWSYRGRRRK